MIQPSYTTGHGQVYFRADNREADRQRILSLILERDRWRDKAEEKIALRREIEAALGIKTGQTNDESLMAGVNAIRALKAEVSRLQALLKAKSKRKTKKKGKK